MSISEGLSRVFNLSILDCEHKKYHLTVKTYVKVIPQYFSVYPVVHIKITDR